MGYSEEDKVFVSRCLNKLSVLKGRPLDLEQLNIFVEQCYLDRLHPKQVAIACSKLAKDAAVKFFSYSDIYDQANPQLNSRDAAMKAWELVIEQIQRRGSRVKYAELPFDDATWKAVRAVGGYERLCDCNYSEMEWKRKAFIDHFQADYEYIQIESTKEDFKRLAGLSDEEIERNKAKVNNLIQQLIK